MTNFNPVAEAYTQYGMRSKEYVKATKQVLIEDKGHPGRITLPWRERRRLRPAFENQLARVGVPQIVIARDNITGAPVRAIPNVEADAITCIETIKGIKYIFRGPLAVTFDDLQAKVAENFGIESKDCVLYLGPFKLQGSRSLADFGIQLGTVITVTVWSREFYHRGRP